MADHAVLSPSSAKRWMACTPSARFEQAFPSSTSVFAEEGTLAHQISEFILKTRLGMGELNQNWLELVKLNSLWTPEMLTHCEQYADYCMALVEPDSIVYVETRVDLSSYIPESFGTNDFMVYTPSKKLLSIRDLKYGKGVAVDSEDNPQLKIYGIGGLNWLQWIYDNEIEKVSVGIYQPRINNNSEWEISVYDLMQWAEEELKPAAALAFKGEGNYVAGDHCEFCKGRKVCATRAAYVMKLEEHDLKTGNLLTDAELTDIITRGEQLIGWYNDVKDHVTSEILKGKTFKGLKLVEGRSNRIYADVVLTENKLLEAGHEGIYTPKELLGVTKLKEVLGAKVFKELVEPDLRKPPGKPTLVNEDDPRSEFDNAVSVFKDAELRSSLASTEE